MDSHGSPYIWKAFIHLLVRDAGALKFFPWLPLLRPIWIQRPRHPRPGLQGWGVRNTKFAGSFVKNTGGPAFRCSSWEIFAKPKDLTWAKFSSCRVWLSEDDSQDSPVPRSQENKAKSPKSPCWLRGLRTSVLWHDVLAYVVEISLTIDYHGSFIIDIWTFFILHLSLIFDVIMSWNCDMLFLTKWQDDVIAMSKLARDPAMYLALWLWSCSVSPWAFTFRVKVVR